MCHHAQQTALRMLTIIKKVLEMSSYLVLQYLGP